MHSTEYFKGVPVDFNKFGKVFDKIFHSAPLGISIGLARNFKESPMDIHRF